MRYLVETEDELILKNISVNNKCIIVPAVNIIGEMPFDEKQDENGLTTCVCPKCGRFLSAYDEPICFCMHCGTKNSEAEDEYAS